MEPPFRWSPLDPDRYIQQLCPTNNSTALMSVDLVRVSFGGGGGGAKGAVRGGKSVGKNFMGGQV